MGEAEDKLKLSEARYRAIVEDQTEFVTRFTPDYVLTFANKALCEYTGRPYAELVGKNFLHFIPREDQEKVKGNIASLTSKNPVVVHEHKVVLLDGSIYWHQWTNRAIFNNEGRIVEIQAVGRDITDQKKAVEAELEKAKRLADIGALAATVAHELRSPLAAIQIAAYNIRKKKGKLPIDKHLTNIEKKVAESDQIINDLLFYSKIKPPLYEKVKVCSLLEECILTVKNRFKKQRVLVKTGPRPSTSIFIDADPLQMKELFNNILSNAFEACPERGGLIEIKCRKDKEGSIGIIFCDNGSGIDEKDMQNIFEPFFSRKAKGTGLGLTICKQVVSLHGGAIDIQSRKGKGTTVAVMLPLSRKKSEKNGIS